jgi:hypothetical protein
MGGSDMRKPAVIIFVLALCVLPIKNFVEKVVGSEPETMPGKVIKVIETYTGNIDQLQERGIFRIASEKDWDPVLAKFPIRKRSIDLNKFMVIAVFGEFPIFASIDNAIENNGVITIYLTHGSLQTIGSGGDGPIIHYRPYGLFVFPKSSNKIVVKEDVQEYLGKPPIWKTVKEFEQIN